MLELQNIYKTFEGRAVLDDVNLSVAKGATHALIGSSGSGKTTLLRITLGLIPFDKGYVKINDQALLSFTQVEWADRIGYVPQDGGLFPHISARNNVALIAKLRGWPKSRIDGRVEELRKVVDLDAEILTHFPREMSGGQKQRVAIMRAAMMDPAVMLLDEPMAALDPLIRRSLQQELKSIFQRLGKTVLLVTHDLGEAVFLAEQITMLHEGRIVQTGTYRDLLLHPASPFVTQFINAQRTLPDAGEAAMKRARHGVRHASLRTLRVLPRVRRGPHRDRRQDFHRELCVGRDRGAVHRGVIAGAGHAQTRDGKHGHFVRGIEERRDRCVPGLHRNPGGGHSQAAGLEVAR